MTSAKYANELAFATQLAMDAGSIMADRFSLASRVEWKEDNSPVTQADLDINRMVIDRVLTSYPDDGILGEEASQDAERSRIWVVDPIDGTQPYTIGVPISTFCLALVIDHEPVLGVVYDPFMKRMYQGVRGEGASVNGERLRVSGADAIAQNYVILSSRMGGDFVSTGHALDRVAMAGGKSFNFRSIAYGCLLVATGGAVGSVAGYCKPWDVAAVSVILSEAGAIITDLEGNVSPYDNNDKGLLVSNGKTHQQLLSLFAKQ